MEKLIEQVVQFERSTFENRYEYSTFHPRHSIPLHTSNPDTDSKTNTQLNTGHQI